jgi:hypothetical protein
VSYNRPVLIDVVGYEKSFLPRQAVSFMIMQQRLLNTKKHSHALVQKSFVWSFNERSRRIRLEIRDPGGMFPLELYDPEVGTYTITKTARGGLVMTK